MNSLIFEKERKTSRVIPSVLCCVCCCCCYYSAADDDLTIILHENGAFAFALHATRNQLTMLLSRLFRIASLHLPSSPLTVYLPILNLNKFMLCIPVVVPDHNRRPTEAPPISKSEQNDQLFIIRISLILILPISSFVVVFRIFV